MEYHFYGSDSKFEVPGIYAALPSGIRAKPARRMRTAPTATPKKSSASTGEREYERWLRGVED